MECRGEGQVRVSSLKFLIAVSLRKAALGHISMPFKAQTLSLMANTCHMAWEQVLQGETPFRACSWDGPLPPASQPRGQVRTSAEAPSRLNL